jgi:hypothetical protein
MWRQLSISRRLTMIACLALALGWTAEASAWGWSRRATSNQQRSANPYAAQYNPAYGPIRYNQWGQPQWPYSQRTTGVTQLGPAPAAAGVRSLPGWGGER